jgi:hypothetical protein
MLGHSESIQAAQPAVTSRTLGGAPSGRDLHCMVHHALSSFAMNKLSILKFEREIRPRQSISISGMV